MTGSRVKHDTTVLVEKGIPIPEEKRGGKRYRVSKYPWEQMEIGDSFFIPGCDTQQFSSRISVAQLRTGYTFTARTAPEGVRIWRTK